VVQIDIAVYDGFDEMDAIGPLEVLRRAARSGADFEVRLATCRPGSMVTGSYGLRLSPDAVFRPSTDVVVVPGGGWSAHAERGVRREVAEGTWPALLAQAARRGALMAGVCTGTLLLAHAGVVGPRRASTHRSARAELAALGAMVVEDRVVDEGTLVTAGGVTSSLDLALWLVERFAGRALADEISTRMEYPRFRPVPG
jgi:transcriptional regulator GlxA family with amidase domain